MEASGRDPRIMGLALLVAVLAFSFGIVIASSPVTVMGAPCGTLIQPSSESSASNELAYRCERARSHNVVPTVLLGLVGLIGLSLAVDHRTPAIPVDDRLTRRSLALDDDDDETEADDEIEDDASEDGADARRDADGPDPLPADDPDEVLEVVAEEAPPAPEPPRVLTWTVEHPRPELRLFDGPPLERASADTDA